MLFVADPHDSAGFEVPQYIGLIAVALIAGFAIGHATAPSGTSQAEKVENASTDDFEKELRINELERENEQLRTLLNNSRETNEAYRDKSDEFLNEIELIIEFEQKQPNSTDADGDGCVDAAEIGYYQTDPLNASDYHGGCYSSGE